MKVALIDGRVSEKIEKKLLLLGFYPIRIPESKRLSKDVCSHPDILMFYNQNTLITSCDFSKEAPWLFSDLRERCKDIKFVFSDDEQSGKYPFDCIYNALVIGGYLICKSDTASGAIINYAKEKNLKIVHSNQGYPACTVLKLNDNCVITSDNGMAQILTNLNIKVYKISNNDIILPERKYGFIGGASGVVDDTVYFLGNPETHRDFAIINEAITECNMKSVALSDELLFDGGKIIFL